MTNIRRIHYKTFSEAMLFMKILVIVPHPDDDVLGCGGSLAKYASLGHEIFSCIVTKAYTPGLEYFIL